MDANKLRVLEDMYTVYPTCGLCEHADIAPNSDWGTCRKQSYRHQKHSNSRRQLSISRYGGCDNFSADPSSEQELGGFAKFLAPPMP